MHGPARARGRPGDEPTGSSGRPRGAVPAGPPRVSPDEGAAAYHAWERGTTSVAQRPRAVQPRRSSARCRTCACSSTRARARPALRVGRRAVVHDPVRTRLDSISAFQALAFRPQIAVEILDVLAAYQATEDDPSRDAEPGKILHELRTGEMARSGELPHTPVLRLGRLDAAVADPARRDVRLDRRPGDGRSAVAECDGRARVDRPVRRPRWRRLRRVRASLGSRAAQPGLEGLERRDPRPERSRGRAAHRPRRGPGLRLRREAADVATRRDARRDGPGASGSMPRPTSSRRDSSRRSGWRTAATTRWRSTATSGRPTRSPATPAIACGPASSCRIARATSSTSSCGPSMFSGWGVRTFAADQPGYNPIGYHTGTVWPHDTSLIAAGFKRYGFDDASNRLVGQMMEAAQGFQDLPPPGAVLRLRPHRRAHAGALPGRLLAAGVGGRFVVPVPRDDARTARPRRPSASSSCSTRTCRTGSAR